MSDMAGSTTSTTSTSVAGASAAGASATGTPVTRTRVTGTSLRPGQASGAVRQARVLVYSDDRATRERVMRAVGRKPARDVEITEWKEFATPVMAEKAVKAGGFDLLILDGEAAPLGGMGLCRQLKYEVFDCPPVVLLTGRPQDAWLAAWSYAERSVSHPLDPMALANAVAELVRDPRERLELTGQQAAR